MAKIACRLLKKMLPYNPGEIAGFEQEEVDDLVERGVVEPIDSNGKVQKAPAPPRIETVDKPPDVTLEVEDDVHVFDLQLPDRVKQLLVAAKLETVAAVLDYQREHGGMTTIRGIGKETADLIAAAVQPYVDDA